ncbi:MAG: Mut7-C RNAse domain-containing protein [Sulfuricella sp.]|nr:Mut7-C RNAse domain-containing protein [Sulfuricella sp.]
MESAPRFLCDVMLARLARYLRAAGLDTALAVESATDAEILREAIDEGRWLLTADRKITEHKAAKGHVIQLPFGTLGLQAAALSGQFNIDWLSHAFTRCLMDNTPLQAATEEHALQVPEDARQPVEELLACPNCGRVYWRGSHYKRMRNKLESWQENPVAAVATIEPL